jgi:hypothetical protein
VLSPDHVGWFPSAAGVLTVAARLLPAEDRACFDEEFQLRGIGRISRVGGRSWRTRSGRCPPGHTTSASDYYEPVTYQVTTASSNSRRSATCSDTDTLLTCRNPTQLDIVRRNRRAWHARGQGFESPKLHSFSYACSSKKRQSSDNGAGFSRQSPPE